VPWARGPVAMEACVHFGVDREALDQVFLETLLHLTTDLIKWAWRGNVKQSSNLLDMGERSTEKHFNLFRTSEYLISFGPLGSLAENLCILPCRSNS
jgi:hypothetical protein